MPLLQGGKMRAKRIFLWVMCASLALLLVACGSEKEHDHHKGEGETSAHEHVWYNGVITKEPTETEYGELVFACKHCKEIKKQVIAKIPHTHSFSTEWEKNELWHWHACVKENCTVTSGSDVHRWDEGEVLTESTQTTVGRKKFTCTVCGATKEEAYVASFRITEEELDRAISRQSFENVTATYMISNYEVCVLVANGKVKYSDEHFSDIEADSEVSRYGSYDFERLFSPLAGKYSSLTYDEKIKAYIYEDENTRITVQFANGRIVFAEIFTDYSVETLTFSAYGKTTVE